MDISTFPPIAAALDGLAALVTALGDLVEPFAGASASALAIVLLTVLVRVALLPVSVSQVRAEAHRRRIAPAVAALRAKYSTKPEALQKALTALYTSEKVSPLAGVLPTLAQAPVLSAVYALFVHPQLAGHANALLVQTLAGLPLSANLFAVIGAVLPGTVLPAAIVVVALLVLLAVVVELTRRANLRWNGSPVAVSSGAPDPVPGAAAVARVARFVPFITVGFAALAPLAAALYLLTSAAWTLGERAVLRRVIRAPRPV